MAKWGKTDYREFEKLQKNIQKFVVKDSKKFAERCAKGLAARVLNLAVKGTPVGEYDKPVNFTTSDGEEVSFQPKTGKTGGTLKGAWRATKVDNNGLVYEVIVYNPTEYASYVEFGHRTVNGGWVEGKFMLTKAEMTVEKNAEKILEKKIQKYFEEEVFDVD